MEERIEKQLKDKFPNGHDDFIPMCLDEIRLHSMKNKDYSGGEGENPLGNFYRVSDMLNSFGLKITPAQVGFNYMMKQVDAAGRMLFGNYEGSVEGKADRLRDISIYAKLTQILDRESSPIVAPITSGDKGFHCWSVRAQPTTKD